ncbi:MAG TPA: hypothetical protein VK142_07970 [Bacillota bacterium]|nr:hypothetical protein [Bacillota bacterium]
MPNEKQRMLRAVSPDLFNVIISELEKYNIHLNDIQANVIIKEDGLDVIVLFGEHFNQTKSRFFTHESIESQFEDIQRFAYDIAEACREVMIADYFKMMKM